MKRILNLHQFQEHIRHNNLFTPSDKLLVAFSGGVDSVVLSHLLLKTGIPFAMAHCNFRLRGKNADEDLAWSKAVAKSWGVTFHSTYFDTAGIAKSRGISIQMAARELRYTWFASLIEKEGYNLLTTGHHADDQAETILFNIAKGTGIAGIRGILPLQNDTVRPLLPFSKDAIYQYAEENKLLWREDASNKNTKYARNKIRHLAIPTLKEINPGFLSAIERLTHKAQEYEKIINHYLEEQQLLIKSDTGPDAFDIDLNKVHDSISPRIVLTSILEPNGFSQNQIDAVLQHPNTGSKFNTATHQACIKKGVLEVRAQRNIPFEPILFHEDEINNLSGRKQTSTCIIHWETHNASGFSIPKHEPWTACFDKDKIHFPLTLRTWQQGDSMKPLGMKGKKKISDILIDAKVSLLEKQNILVLEDASQRIIWLAGFRVSDIIKVTPKTTEVVMLSLTRKL